MTHNKLYPLTFEPILKSVIWGGNSIQSFKQISTNISSIGESWEISSVKDNISIVSNGTLKGASLKQLIDKYKEDIVGKKNYQQYGNTFPLLIKFIDARDDLSIQVHPDDSLAHARHQSYGKTEMWYVINATPNAYLYAGWAKNCNPALFIQSINDNTLLSYLCKHDVKKGDVFFLPAGRVHAIGKGILIAEIQQTSDITYRIFDYNRKDLQGNSRELHIDQAIDAIDFSIQDNYRTAYTPVLNTPTPLVECPYFTTNLLELSKPIKRCYKDTDSFVILICTEGEALIETPGNTPQTLQRGQTTLIPAAIASCSILPNKGTTIIETFTK